MADEQTSATRRLHRHTEIVPARQQIIKSRFHEAHTLNVCGPELFQESAAGQAFFAAVSDEEHKGEPPYLRLPIDAILEALRGEISPELAASFLQMYIFQTMRLTERVPLPESFVLQLPHCFPIDEIEPLRDQKLYHIGASFRRCSSCIECLIVGYSVSGQEGCTEPLKMVKDLSLKVIVILRPVTIDTFCCCSISVFPWMLAFDGHSDESALTNGSPVAFLGSGTARNSLCVNKD